MSGGALAYFEFPWHVMWFPPETVTLLKVQKSSVPVAVLRRQIVELPACCNPAAI
jgi:hypothetical protein